MWGLGAEVSFITNVTCKKGPKRVTSGAFWRDSLATSVFWRSWLAWRSSLANTSTVYAFWASFPQKTRLPIPLPTHHSDRKSPSQPPHTHTLAFPLFPGTANLSWPIPLTCTLKRWPWILVHAARAR